MNEKLYKDIIQPCSDTFFVKGKDELLEFIYNIFKKIISIQACILTIDDDEKLKEPDGCEKNKLYTKISNIIENLEFKDKHKHKIIKIIKLNICYKSPNLNTPHIRLYTFIF